MSDDSEYEGSEYGSDQGSQYGSGSEDGSDYDEYEEYEDKYEAGGSDSGDGSELSDQEGSDEEEMIVSTPGTGLGGSLIKPLGSGLGAGGSLIKPLGSGTGLGSEASQVPTASSVETPPGPGLAQLTRPAGTSLGQTSTLGKHLSSNPLGLGLKTLPVAPSKLGSLSSGVPKLGSMTPEAPLGVLSSGAPKLGSFETPQAAPTPSSQVDSQSRISVPGPLSREQVEQQLSGITVFGVNTIQTPVLPVPDPSLFIVRLDTEDEIIFEVRKFLTTKFIAAGYSIRAAVTCGHLVLNKTMLGVSYGEHVEHAINYMLTSIQE